MRLPFACTSLTLGLTLGLILSGAASASFIDVTLSSGLDYLHGSGKGVIDSAGACAVDIDGDGWTDLIVARGTQPCLVFMNQRNGTFVEDGHARGLDAVSSIGGIAAGDFSNSGHPDIVMTPANGSRYYFFANDGTGHFTEQAVVRGIDATVTLEKHKTYTVSLVDYDRDGFLDLYTCETPVPATSEDALHSVLLRNRGASAPGFFENATLAAGVKQPRSDSQHHGFTGLWADFDGDGWQDLSLLSDFKTSQLWWNNGNRTFTEGATAAGVGKEENGMGGAVADYDGDGNLDFVATSIFDRVLSETKGIALGNKLYRNLGNRHFDEVSKTAGLAHTGWAWGAAFLDYDNDGWPDLLVTNGTDFTKGADPRITPYTDAVNDPTTLYSNLGDGTFADITAGSGIRDTDLGRSLVVMDLDNDGDEDVIVTNAFGHPVVYRSNASENGKHWLRLRFQGSDSNRDGYGALVRATAGGRVITSLYAPTNAFMAQREPVLHLGLGAAGSVTRLEITWPRGAVQVLENVAVDQVLSLTEPSASDVAPSFTSQPSGGDFEKDRTVTLSAAATGSPAPVYVWLKDGVAIPGANRSTYVIRRIHPMDAGRYTVQAINPKGAVTSADALITVSLDLSRHSAARWWNEALLDGIRKDVPNPPVHARNLYHLSSAIWDAFWAYQEEGWTKALPLYHKEALTPADWVGGREAAQQQALSYAAYRVLTQRFKNSPGAARTLFGARWLMQRFGYDPDFTGVDGNTPAAVGNRIGYAVLAATINDGANEANRYVDATGYTALNEPLIVSLPGTTMADPNHWQPLSLKFSVTQNGIPQGGGVQAFVGANALTTEPFALVKPTRTSYAIDPGPPPRLGSETDAEFKRQALEVISLSAQLDPNDGALVDISPEAHLNNSLGSNDGLGHAVNPATGLPYAANIVRRADYGRVLAEFWADGPNSETPPGHWNVVFNQVTDHPLFHRRYGGAGPELSPLEWDVRGYLALNGAVHDAACLAWGLKHLYDSARPISMIRHMGGLGQSTNPAGPSYHASGLPLVPGLVEVVTAESSAPGQRHAHLADRVGKIAIRSWKGNPVDPQNQIGGVDWILAENWVPFQMATFVTPAFPAYVSGHSTFSRAAAEAITLLTGSPYFPGGLSEYAFPAGSFLTFEKGPASDVTLQWATYYDAADQAGRSRLWGGIHIEADDFTGRRLGSQVGVNAFLEAQRLRNGAAPSAGLVNLSSRGQAGADDRVMIAGFVVDNGASVKTLLRCVGPGLEPFGISQAECDPNPRLEVHRQGVDTVLLANDDWSLSPRSSLIAAQALAVGAFALPGGSSDAAEMPDLEPGVYSVVCRSSSPEAHGVQLVEVYGERLRNLSTRGYVGSGSGVLIAGFSVRTDDPALILLRGVGPALGAFGVPGTIEAPVLTVYHQVEGGAPQVIAVNRSWFDAGSPSLVIDAGVRSGAFAVPSDGRDAALTLQLPAGNYTAVLSTADGRAGVGLIEVYHVK